MESSSIKHLHDLPDVILWKIFSLVTSTRTRNAMSLVCTKWLGLERATRTSISIRGNVRDLFLIPSSFRQVTNLDLSLISPWGHSLLDDSNSGASSSSSSSFYADPTLLAHRLAQAFPSVTSLTVYARTPSTLHYLTPHFPFLSHAKLVRWHQRAPTPLGSDFVSLLAYCPSISTIDLSHFYCWTEDLPPALAAYPAAAASLTHLNLLTTFSSEGFKSQELIAISNSCPNLRHLLAACMFDPRYVDFVGYDALLAIAVNCPRLTLLHLAHAPALSGGRGDPDDDGFTQEDARISRNTLEEIFAGLPLLEELTLDVCHNVRDAGPALEMLNSKCPHLKSLALGQFHGICREEWQLNGIALCANLESLSIKNSADLTDSSLLAISRGCPRLTRFAIQGCKNITEIGMKSLVGMLRRTLIDVWISCCKNLDAVSSLRALEPIRDRIRRLHIDCVWNGLEGSERPAKAIHHFDLNEFEPSQFTQPTRFSEFTESGECSNGWCEDVKQKKCRYSTEAGCSSQDRRKGRDLCCRTWKQLRHLSLWIAVGELLTPLRLAGLESCPVLEEIQIKVEGDSRRCPKPIKQAFGLGTLEFYPHLSKMQLNCGDAIGYALTAPSGHMDLSLWERFYLRGIELLNLSELNYWPPQDRDVNQRSLSLPAAGLLAECATLRKLFIHGTAHEHFMKFLLKIPNLRDVQLREDYYPAPENDTSTEMRVDSCSRFEDDLNNRQIPD